MATAGRARQFAPNAARTSANSFEPTEFFCSLWPPLALQDLVLSHTLEASKDMGAVAFSGRLLAAGCDQMIRVYAEKESGPVGT